MNDQPRQQLRNLIQERGTNITQDPRLVKNLLSDLCGEHKREIHLLHTALEQQIARDILSSSDTTLSPALAARLVKRLENECCMITDAAQWSVAAWCFALEREINIEHLPQISLAQKQTQISGRVPTPVVNLLPVPFEWVHIPAGMVTMVEYVQMDEDTVEDEPVEDNVPDFDMAKYPITNAQFSSFVEAGGYSNRAFWTAEGWHQKENDGFTEPLYWRDPSWNGGDYPVVGVSWHEAWAFCQWLRAVSGEPITLPTESQWQRTANPRDSSYRWAYPWDENFDASRCNCYESNVVKTTPVTHYPNGVSRFGVLDMAGNVSEWCFLRHDGYEQRRPVLKGGSWHDYHFSASTGSYTIETVEKRLSFVGFRIIRDALSELQ